jgi:hypothetical protein
MASSEDNNLWVRIAAIVQMSPLKDNSSELDNISKYDALIKEPLELILSKESEIKIKMTRHTCLSTNLNENLKTSGSNSSSYCFGSNSTQSDSNSSANSNNSYESLIGISGNKVSTPKALENSGSQTNFLMADYPSTQSSIGSSKPNISKQKSLNSINSSIGATLDVLKTSREHLALKPDFALYASKFLMFVGEEESSENKSRKAEMQLRKVLGTQSSCLPWSIFGNIPLLFGYTACGNEVKLLCYNNFNEFEELKHYDLKKSLDCVKLFIHMTKVARIILEFSSALIKWPFTFEKFFVENQRNLGSSVFHHLDGVVKVYEKKSAMCNEEKAKRIIGIYTHLMMHPDIFDGYAIQCKKIVDTDATKTPKVEFHLEPLCKPIRQCLFDGVKDLLYALWCVLKVLVELHKVKYVHGDIRWPNIMYDVVGKKFVLIDFDNGGKSPLKFYTTDDLLIGFPADEMKQNSK